MRKLGVGNAVWAAVCAAMISACGGGTASLGGGGSSSGGTSSGGTSSGGTSSGGTSSGGVTVTPATLRLVSSATALPSDADTSAEGITFNAIATDASNNTLAGVTVRFTASSGALIVAAATTDPSGVARATLTTGGDASLRTITVSAAAGTVSGGSIPVNVVAPTSPAVIAPGLGNGTGVAYVDQAIRVGQANLAAGGSTSLRLDLVDRNNSNAPLTSVTPSIGFSSPCISNGRAAITAPATINGGAVDATYVARGCAGNDVITATAVLSSGSTLTATGTVNVQPAVLGSIKFDSSTPATIGLKGSGLQETSVVRFQLFDSSGGPAPSGVDVGFALNTSVGGITLTPATAQTDAQGLVQTVINSGTVATPVRVTATAATAGGGTISSQSEQLTISTTLPDQNSFSLSVSTRNIDANEIDGVTTTVTVRLADRFNNPVPNGTAVLFTTEGGSIEPQCKTVGGACSVIFTSQEPRSAQLAAPGTAVSSANGCDQRGNPSFPVGSYRANPDPAFGCDDHRYSILATAIGEESFTDSNANGRYDGGEPFVDLDEAYTDANENGSYETSFETFADFDRNGSLTARDGKFTGTLCSGANCSTAPNPPAPPTLNARGNAVIVMSSSGAKFGPALDRNGVTIGPGSTTALALPINSSASAVVYARDSSDNCMASGTVISAQTTYGSLVGPSSFTQPDSVAKPCNNGYGFTVSSGTTAGSGTLLISVRSPSGLVTLYSIAIN